MDRFGDDIARYHKGELTAAERHALEKKALSDPFLADALEGAGQISSADFSADIGALKAKIGAGGSKPIFTPLRIAAGVTVLVATGWLGLYLINENESAQLTLNKQSPAPAAAGAKDSAAAPYEERVAGEQEEAQAKDQLLSLNQPKNEKKEDARPAPATATEGAGPLATKPAEDPRELASADRADTQSDSSADIAEADMTPQPAQPLAVTETRAEDEIQVVTRRERASGAAKMKSSVADDRDGKAGGLAEVTPGKITGQVTLAEDGMALPGVNVRLKGSSTATVTDLNGVYTIETNEDKPTLVFSFIGLETKEQKPTEASTLDVTLSNDESQLSEVVVTGKKIPSDLTGDPVIKLAEPAGGHRAYDKYLDNNVRYPQQALDNNVKGRVTIQFTVGINGSLGEFTVMKGLGFGCDEEVIRLVKDGPAWSPTTENNVPTESVVRVRMKFDAAKAKQK